MSDTTSENAKLLFKLIQGLSLEERAMRFFDLNETVRAISRQGIRIRNPEFTDEQVREEFRKICLESYR